MTFAPLAVKTVLLGSPVKSGDINEGDEKKLTYKHVTKEGYFGAVLHKSSSEPTSCLNVEDLISTPSASSTILATTVNSTQKVGSILHFISNF